MILSDPTNLRRFHVETELARGGMGAVFAVQDQATGRRMALKRLAPSAPARAAALFEHEFYVLSSLKHPRIIEVYEYGIDADGPFYTMELLEGSDLRELSPMESTKACRYLRDVASSLALLHARRLLHRDVSPRNVRTTSDGSCKLIDFGALAAFGTNEEIVGTPPAIAPEALAGQALDQRTDLYALGALGYFLLTGRHAYAARSVNALPDAWASQLAPPSQLVPGVPKELDALLMSLLSLDLLGRPTSAAEVIERLNTIAGFAPEHDEQVARSYFAGTQLVERDRELERARRRLLRAKKSEGSALFIEGAAGIGKTRLLTDITLRAQLLGLTTLRVDAEQHNAPLELARVLVQQALRLSPRAARAAFAAAAGTLRLAWPDNLPELDAPVEPASEDARKHAQSAAPALLESCFVELSERHPLLIAVDNVQYADAPSAAVLMSLARRCHKQQLMLVFSAEPSAQQSAAVRGMAESARRVPLGALSQRGTLELVRAAFGDVPQVKRTAKRLFDATQGHPQHCMQLLEQWLATGLIRYVGGSFSLPLDIPEAQLAPFEGVVRARLAQVSADALWVARVLSQMSEPVPFDACVAFARTRMPDRQVISAIDELLRAEVLSQGAQGLRFCHALLRTAADESLQPDERKSLSLALGEHLLAHCDGSFLQLSAAAHHLMRAGEMRGAELLASAARKELDADNAGQSLSSGFAALETALEMYRTHGRGRLEQLELLVPLLLGGVELSYTTGMRYIEPALSALQDALGLTALQSRSTPPDLTELFTVLGAAPVLEPGEVKTERSPDVVVLIGWLIRGVLAACNLASVAIDHEAAARYVRALWPFLAFGPTHPTALVYDFCNLVIAMTSDRFAQTHAGWCEMLQRLDQVTLLPPAVVLQLRLGAVFSLGLLECQTDDKARALARFEEVDRLGNQFDRDRSFMLDQLRVLFHGFRGEVAEAERYRDIVEAHAVQRGETWRAEVWATCTMNAVYANTRDADGVKRTTEQLQRLHREMPSLEPYYERALATTALVNGAPARAAALYEKTLARPDARDRVGWATVRGGLAMVYNDLGQHERARQICEETLAVCAINFDYVSMTMNPQLQLCRALAGLGQWADAQAQLDQVILRYADSDNPVTRGAMHRTAAELASMQGDVLAFEHHLNEMQRWHTPTKNPALIAQCERMRNEAAGVVPDAASSGEILTYLTTAQGGGSATFLTTCRTTAERRQRALELVAAQATAAEAYLFARNSDNEPVLLCQLGENASATPQEALMDALRAMFEDMPDDSEDTAFVAGSDLTSATTTASRHRLLPLTVEQENKRMLIGAIAIAGAALHRPVSHALLRDLALALFRSGDLVSARTLG